MTQDTQDQTTDEVAVRHQNLVLIGAARGAEEFGEGLLGACALLFDLGARDFSIIDLIGNKR